MLDDLRSSAAHCTQCLEVDFRLRLAGDKLEHLRRLSKQLVLPIKDLIGMNIKLRAQFSQCMIIFDGGKCDFGLEVRRVVATGSSAHGMFHSWGVTHTLRGAAYHLEQRYEFMRPAQAAVDYFLTALLNT